MRNIWVFVVAALALGAAAWFLLGDDAPATGLGAGDEAAGLTDAQLLEGDVGGSLAGAGLEAGASAGTIEATPEKTSDPLALGGFIVRGRTVDETRRPIQATIAARFTGREPVVVETNADGTFEVALGERPRVQSGSVFAQSDGDLAALGMFWMAMRVDVNEADVGVMVMRRGQPLDLRVMHGGDPVAGARVALTGSGRWGRQMLFLQGVADDNGALHVPLVPAGALTILAAGGAETGRGRANISVPQKTRKPVEVELTDERTLEVTVVDKVTGDPVPGAVVRAGDARSGPSFGSGYLPALSPAVTDADGRTQIRGLQSEPKESLRLAVVADGYPQPTTSWGPGSRVNTAGVKHDAREVRIELQQNRSVSFPIEGDLSPPEGAKLAIKRPNMYGGSTAPDDVTAVVTSGEVIVEGLSPGHTNGTLTTNEGLVAKFFAPANATEGKPITFKQGRVLTVRVLEADGKPLVGKSILLRAGNNNQGVGTATTDEQGECALPPTEVQQATILMAVDANGSWWNAIPIGSVDLTTHTGIKEIVLPARAPLVFEIKLDGKAGLPSQFYLTVAGQYVQSTLIREDPGAGRLTLDRILADNDKPVAVQFWAEGFLSFDEKIERSALRAPVPIALQPAGSIVVRYAPPEDGRVQLAAQLWDAKSETWMQANSQTLNRPQAPTEDNTRRFEGMKAGRYRIRERQSNATSDPFDVILGAPTEIQMDLSALTYTEGRIVLPSGFKPTQAWVTRTDGGRPSRPKADGSFKLRAQRGAPTTLTVSHPLLMPDVEGGVKTRGGATGVLLKLKTGADLVFTIEGVDAKGGRLRRPTLNMIDGAGAVSFEGNMRQMGVTFRLFEGGTTDGKALRTGTPLFVDGDMRIGGLAPGTYSLWLLRAGYVPKTLRSIEVTKGPKDLGTLQMSKGSNLQIKLVATDGKPLGNVWANAVFTGAPKYSRNGSSNGKSDMQLSGLGAGSFKVTIHSHRLTVGSRESKKVFDEEVQMDGSNDVSITVTVD